MNYTFMPSLEQRALIKTAITLWNPAAIHLDDIECAEDHVTGKVKELPLPESLKEKISGFIEPISFEILGWIRYYQNILSNNEIGCSSMSNKRLVDVDVNKKVAKSLSKLCWTPQGTVDRKKTAEELIRDENLDITVRYKLASIFCLRNDILILWNKMPEYCRKSFYSEEDPREIEQNDLVVFWTYDIKGELTRFIDILKTDMGLERLSCTSYGYAFLLACDCHNKVATEYFWQNLTCEEREELPIRAVGLIIDDERDPGEKEEEDVLFFVLSQMNEEQQSEALKKYSRYVLVSLLHWPWQDFFMETANCVWAFLSGDDYFYLLDKIIVFVKCGHKDYDYKKLFREFWQKIPITHKEYVRDQFARYSLLYLFEIEDKEYFNIIFTSILDREKLLFSDDGKSACGHLIFRDKMDFLEVFVRACISSKDIIMKFREEFENFIIHYHLYIKKTRGKKAKLSKFFQLLDQLVLENDKRKHVDEGNTDPAAKRLCSHTK